MFKKLDSLLHSESRLAIISLLVSVESADFSYIFSKMNISAGNLSAQIQKLNTAGYITTTKGFKGNMPKTTCKITEKGLSALSDYVDTLRAYLPQLDNIKNK